MANAIQSGQIWHCEATGENWLVTRVYLELFTSYAVLRKLGGSDQDVQRVKIERSEGSLRLPGFNLTEEV